MTRGSRAAPRRQPLANGYWVIPDRWFAGEHPAGRSLAETRERLERLHAAGLDFFIDLTAAEELPAYAELLPPDAVYVRRPLPDHGIPEEPGHMAGILATIDDALADGRNVYLHCRAGIGRTGMTVGCHLAASGRSGAEALEMLAGLWRQSARSAEWPVVPETAEQADYVEAWAQRGVSATAPGADPELDLNSMSAARRLRERFHGLLLGLAVGDALAAATQYRRPGSFPPVGDLLGGGPFDLPRGGWSDDTAMALCLAESLLSRRGFEVRDQMERYVRWQQEGHLSATGECVGITASVARALATAAWRRVGFGGSHDPVQLDKEPLSRVGVVVMFYFADAAQAIQHAAEAARTTCQAPAALEACRRYAAMLHAALSGRGKAEILAAAPPARSPGGGGIVAALEIALQAFATTSSFRAGALQVVNLGGDSDVHAAAYGQLAGAFHGATGIPEVWRKSLIRKELIDDTADRLLTEALVSLGGPD